ncbi:hypothetical protein P168DRAFT_285934 [Aspergillus campestris IBT 28561]|uniref:Transcription factor Rba50 n=1 Tax=Aspergillus campestris (strain IBT 28561) TaxID=1392248 RepID=A0A2I1DCY7_ASPC2|nr:uncharacterized protein P168DRAFT_285934 [Aspergillus campestris IBT 28561]PKY07734.1 hypothetical protein P168DRAFT_285934 [Aspergillus campestris IBT 28561]
MAFRGERFVIDLDSDDEDVPGSSSVAIPGMIGEIRERSPAAAPAPPTLKAPSTTGFPAPRRRVKTSAFKQRQQGKEQKAEKTSEASPPPVSDEKAAIDDQNRRQLQAMSTEQIEREREELMESLDTGLLERFLRRARIDDPKDSPADSTDRQSTTPNDNKEETQPATTATPPHVESLAPKNPPLPSPPATASVAAAAAAATNTTSSRDDLPPSQLPPDLRAAAEAALPADLHFPTPPQASQAPNLDPNSPSFLTDLQTHYFPDISHNPSALDWLQPPPADTDSPDVTSAYHPASEAEAVHPADLRFSLLGTVLAPRTALALPTSLGLHHHGKDPHAAGYTVPELAILGRSSFPAQRCIAWQVLGRILYRLGKGQLGERGTPLVEGLWGVIENERVVPAMLNEADGSTTGPTSRRGSDRRGSSSEGQVGSGLQGAVGRHASAVAWAVEGVWLWQMGGAGDRGVIKENAVRSQ